jgi:hypothetical protein
MRNEGAGEELLYGRHGPHANAGYTSGGVESMDVVYDALDDQRVVRT